MRWRQRRLGGALLGRHADEETDLESFGRFYGAYSERVLVFHTRRVLDVDLAMDLTAETFAVALERRRQFRGLTAEEEQGWLFAIARSQLSHLWRRGSVERDAMRRLSLDTPRLSEVDIERVEELADLAAYRASIAEAMDELSDEQRAAIDLRVVQELDYSEVAAILGVNEAAVRARVSRGLAALAGRLDHLQVKQEQLCND